MSPADPAVLVVEDEEALAELFEMWLDEHCDVRTVTNGQDALAALDDTIDVVVLDWRMPGVPGKEILAEIRDRELGCAVAVVTGFTPDFDDIEYTIDASLTKPVSSEDLTEVVLELAGTAVVD